MKPHPRIRKTVKWGGAAVTMFLCAVILSNLAWEMMYGGAGWGVTVGYGAVTFYKLQSGRFYCDGLELSISGSGWEWLPHWGGLGTPIAWAYIVCVPIWMPLVCAAFPAWAVWRGDYRRRARLNLCPNCNYDRTGLSAGAVCPECGSPPSLHHA